MRLPVCLCLLSQQKVITDCNADRVVIYTFSCLQIQKAKTNWMQLALQKVLDFAHMSLNPKPPD